MPVVAAAHHPWPPAFSPAFVNDCRALLRTKPVLVIVGPTGGNRNQLAAEIAGLPGGPARRRHTVRVGEKALPYFALRQLVLDLDDLPDPTPDLVEAAARAAIRASDGTPTLVLTNADLCDPDSVEVLVRLAETDDIRLIVTMAPENAAERDRLVSTGHLVEIPVLDGAAVVDLLNARFGVPPHPTLAELVLLRSGGSYTVVQELADTSFASGLIVIVEGMLILNPDGPEPGAARLAAHLTPLTADRPGDDLGITDLMHLTSLLGQLDLDEARATLGAAVVDLALSQGALTTAEDGLSFTFPAEAALVQDALPLERCVELFQRYADSLPRTLARPGNATRAADWWRASGRLLPVNLAERAAREANHLGRYRRAMIYTDPANNEAHRHIALIERTHALRELGQQDYREIFSDIDPHQLSEDELLLYLWCLFEKDPTDQREQLTERAVAADDPSDRRRREAVRTLVDLINQSAGTGGDQVASRLRALAFSAQLSPANRALTFAILASVLRQSGRPQSAVEAGEFAVEILTADRESVSAFHLDLARELHIVALVAALDIAEADAAVAAYSSGVLGRPGSGRLTSVWQAYVAMARGDMPEALASAHLCLRGLVDGDPHHIRGWIEAMAAEMLVRLGRDEEAKEMLDAALQHDSPVPTIDLSRRIAIANTYDLFAEPEEGLRILTDVIVEARRDGMLQSHIDAAGASVLIGGPPQVRELLDVVESLVDPTGRPQVWQSFAKAASAYDIPALLEITDSLSARGAHLFAAQLAQFVLDIARRATDLTLATRERLADLADLSIHRTSQRAGNRPDE